MAMAVGGGKKGPIVDMNVTPLIDVLLVLLIIFMVVNQRPPDGLDALVPQPNKDQKVDQTVLEQTVIVQIDQAGNVKINQTPSSMKTLGSQLEDIFKTRSTRVIFVKGDPNTEFQYVAEAIDIAKGAGIDKIGLITKALESQ
jgi:biopolymer transport protein TolR